MLLGHSLSACGDEASGAEVFRDLRAQLENQAALKSSMSAFYRMNKLNLMAASTFANKVRRLRMDPVLAMRTRFLLDRIAERPAAITCVVQAEFAARVQSVEDSEEFFPRTYSLPDERKQLVEYDTNHKPEAWVRPNQRSRIVIWCSIGFAAALLHPALQHLKVLHHSTLVVTRVRSGGQTGVWHWRAGASSSC